MDEISDWASCSDCPISWWVSSSWVEMTWCSALSGERARKGGDE